ncbi:hypothetical protein C8J57DRAFT_1391358 [Mycena rebaudengoi]|nr:hypothetical protein C8J57DRAFT_1391358 [Mycena rebaudengoi]
MKVYDRLGGLGGPSIPNIPGYTLSNFVDSLSLRRLRIPRQTATKCDPRPRHGCVTWWLTFLLASSAFSAHPVLLNVPLTSRQIKSLIHGTSHSLSEVREPNPRSISVYWTHKPHQQGSVVSDGYVFEGLSVNRLIFIILVVPPDQASKRFLASIHEIQGHLCHTSEKVASIVWKFFWRLACILMPGGLCKGNSILQSCCHPHEVPFSMPMDSHKPVTELSLVCI